MDVSKFLKTILLMLLLVGMGYYFSLDYFGKASFSIYPFILISSVVLVSSFYFKDKIYLRSFMAFGILITFIFSIPYILIWNILIVFIALMIFILLFYDSFFTNKGLLAYSFFILSLAVVLTEFSEPEGWISIPISAMIVTGFLLYNRINPKDIKSYIFFSVLIVVAGIITVASPVFLYYISQTYLILFLLYLLPLAALILLIYKLYAAAKNNNSFDWKLFLVSGAIILLLAFVFYPRDAGWYYGIIPSHMPPNVPRGKECNCIGISYSVPGGCDFVISPIFSACSAGGLGYMKTKCAGIPYNCHMITQHSNLSSNVTV